MRPRSLSFSGLALLALLVVAGCGSKKDAISPSIEASERGVASYYADEFQGRRTASGEVYDMNAMTAAHPSLPFGTIVRVINLNNGKRVELRINDRGPFTKGRIPGSRPSSR